MPRIRTLKPEHRGHRKIARLSDAAYRCWVGLINEVDDDGRVVYDLDCLNSAIFTIRRKTRRQFEALIRELHAARLVVIYTAEGYLEPVLSMHDFGDHQPKDKFHYAPSKLPGDSEGTPVSLNGDSVETLRSPGMEGTEGREGNQAASTPPGTPAFQIPESIRQALSRCSTFVGVQRLHAPAFWQAQVRAHPAVDFGRELLKAQAWIEANPKRAPRSNLMAFLHNWFRKAQEDTSA